jgi:hypothetical protein
MTVEKRKIGFMLYALQAIAVLGVLISLARHETTGTIIFGLLAGLSSFLVNRIVRPNPGVLRRSRSTTTVHILFLWCVAGCIALFLIGTPLLHLFTLRH